MAVPERKGYERIPFRTIATWITFFALLQVAIGVFTYVFDGNFNRKFDRDLNQTMSAYGHNENKTIRIDNMQTKFQCCGNRGFTDWSDMSPPMEIPLSCCKVAEHVCNVTDTNDINTQGCYTPVLQETYRTMAQLIGVGVGLSFVQLILIWLVCYSSSTFKKIKDKLVAWNLRPSQKSSSCG